MPNWNWDENRLVSDNNCNIGNIYVMPMFYFYFYKEWQIMLGLHEVVVTLYGQFAIGDTKYKD